MYEYKNVRITKYLHDGFRIDYLAPGNKVIYIDPFKLPNNQPKADFILITHEHFDHLDKESIKKILGEDTVILGNPLVNKELTDLALENFFEVRPNESKDFESFKVHTKPAYNTNKFKEDGTAFHPNKNNGVGYLLEFKGNEVEGVINVYHTGDSDFITEMEEPMAIDILMVPVSGTYVMTAQEAAKATNVIDPNIAIPMHHDAGIAGSKEDAEVFRERVNCEVIELKAEE